MFRATDGAEERVEEAVFGLVPASRAGELPLEEPPTLPAWPEELMMGLLNGVWLELGPARLV